MTPSVGRVVHYWPKQDDSLWQDASPLGAMIVRVHDDHTITVNVATCNRTVPCWERAVSVTLLDEVSDRDKHAGCGKCTWPVGRS